MNSIIQFQNIEGIHFISIIGLFLIRILWRRNHTGWLRNLQGSLKVDVSRFNMQIQQLIRICVFIFLGTSFILSLLYYSTN